MGTIQGCIHLQCDWLYHHMDTQATEHMYTNRGEKRILDTLFSSCKSIPSLWSFFQELKVFWKLGWLELGFCHGFLCHLGQYFQVCSRGCKQANRSSSACALSLWTWASSHLGPICPNVPMLTDILCFRSLQILLCLSHFSSRHHCPSSKLDRHRCMPLPRPLQHTFPYLSVCLPLVRLKRRCWTVKWSSWCTSTSAEPDAGAVISGRSAKQTAGGSKVWRGHN